jgi:hypothetical protein
VKDNFSSLLILNKEDHGKLGIGEILLQGMLSLIGNWEMRDSIHF